MEEFAYVVGKATRDFVFFFRTARVSHRIRRNGTHTKIRWGFAVGHHKSLANDIDAERVMIWRWLDIIHARMNHAFVFGIVHKTNLGAFRQEGALDEIRMTFGVTGTARFHHLVLDFECTDRFFKDRWLCVSVYQVVHVIDNQLDPFGVRALVVGVQVDFVRLTLLDFRMNVSKTGHHVWSNEFGVQSRQ